MDTEKWECLWEIDDRYYISSLGRVKSMVFGKERIMKCNKLKIGYVMVNIKQKYHYVHRLVALHFLFKEDGLNEVHHKNGIKDDNRVDNLEWTNRSLNCLHMYNTLNATPPLKGRTGKLSHVSKPILQFSLDGEFIKEYCSITICASENGFSSSNISNGLIKGRKSYGYIWKYK